MHFVYTIYMFFISKSKLKPKPFYKINSRVFFAQSYLYKNTNLFVSHSALRNSKQFHVSVIHSTSTKLCKYMLDKIHQDSILGLSITHLLLGIEVYLLTRNYMNQIKSKKISTYVLKLFLWVLKPILYVPKHFSPSNKLLEIKVGKKLKRAPLQDAMSF